MNDNERIIKLHHVDPDNCRTYYQLLDDDRYYCTLDDGHHEGIWFTVSPCGGYWEPDCPLRAGLVMVIVDDGGNETARHTTVAY